MIGKTKKKRMRFKKESMEVEGGWCPYCGNDGKGLDEIVYGLVDFEAGGVGQKVSCNRCDSSWWVEYTFSGISPGVD